MHKFVQSAIDAANEGDKNKAMSFLKEVLSANPNDVDAWLVLAAVVDEPQRKRQCLNRVLALDPMNKLAREELFEMERSEVGTKPPFTPESSSAFAPDASADQTQGKPAPVSQPKSQPKSQPSMPLGSNKPAKQPTPTQTRYVSLNDWDEEKPKAKTPTAPKSTAKPRADKPMVFKYSVVTRVITYIFAVIFLCSFAFAFQDPRTLILPCGLSVIILPAVWIVSKQVEVSEKGIRVSQLFGLMGTEVAWGDITRIKSASLQKNLALTTKKGNTVKVTTQVVGYPSIVETLRQKRPDLFGTPPAKQSNAFASDYGTSPSMGSDIPSATPSFSGTRTFKKSLFKQYGMLLFVIPLAFLSAWTAFTTTDSQYRIGAGISAVFCFIFIVLPFLQVGSVKVGPNKLTVESFIEQKDFSAKEIREIKMQSVRGRYGRVTNYVNIVTAQGKNYPLQGFNDGDEIIYGILHQWWESYRTR